MGWNKRGWDKYNAKREIGNEAQKRHLDDSAIFQLSYKILEIGAWDMDTDATKTIVHNFIDWRVIRLVEVIIRPDSDGYRRNINFRGDASGYAYASNLHILMVRTNAGEFDSILYQSTLLNRGWVIIWYV